eukprot:2514620-Amphidinium_carterae.1
MHAQGRGIAREHLFGCDPSGCAGLSVYLISCLLLVLEAARDRTDTFEEEGRVLFSGDRKVMLAWLASFRIMKTFRTPACASSLDNSMSKKNQIRTCFVQTPN